MNFLNSYKKLRTKRFMPFSFIQNLFTVKKDNCFKSNRTQPPEVSITISGSLSSYNHVVLISASSDVLGVTYFWSGPLGFTSMQQNVFVVEPGIYTVTVINPANDHSSNASVVVVQEPEPSTKDHYPDLMRGLNNSKKSKGEKSSYSSTKY
jgi:hypothetical protein